MTDPRDSDGLTGTAARLAARWCAGHVIDGEPAIAHASRVARTLRHYVPDIPAVVVAAALLHDAPEVARIVADPHAEHDALDRGTPIPPADLFVMLASTADKIVSLHSVLRRGRTSRPQFRAVLGYLRSFANATHGRIPPAMAVEFGELVNLATARNDPREFDNR
jgi:hypothetical protein